MPRAIGMLTLGWNPHYFANPPAYTDLLQLVFAAWFGGRAGVSHTFAANPTAVFTLARVCAALLGTLAVWLLYLAGARLFDRGVALLAAALEAVAFLPVFYAHLALNDVPTLAPLTLSLLGTAGVLRSGPRARLPARRASASGSPARRSTPPGSCCCRCSPPPPRSTWTRPRRGRRVLGRPRARRRCARSPPSWSPTPTRCSTSTPSSRDSCTSPRSPAKRRASSARRARAGSSTTCGRSPGASAGCPRSPRSRGAVDGLVARAPRSAGCSCRRRCSTCCSWAPGPLLRALAAADLPDPLPARRLLRAAGLARGRRRLRSLAAARLGRGARPRARARGRCRVGARRAALCAQGLALQRPLRPRALARRHAQRSRARGWSRTCPSARRSWSSRSCPTSGCRTSATPRCTVPDGDRWIKYPSLRSRDLAHRRARRPAKATSSASRTTSARSARR